MAGGQERAGARGAAKRIPRHLPIGRPPHPTRAARVAAAVRVAAAARVAAAVGALVAVTVVLAGCGSGASPATVQQHRAQQTYGITGALPAVGRPRRGGTITVGQLAGQVPTDILPLVGGEGCTTPTLEFIQQQYLPLYAGPDGGTPAVDEALSAATPPVYTNGDRTVTITLKPGLRWSDGTAVDARDVIFDIDLLRAAVRASPANWCQYAPGGFPDNVAAVSTEGTRTVVLRLKHPVNPGWFTADQLQDLGAGIYPLPSRVWNVDSAVGGHVNNWATDPATALAIFQYLDTLGHQTSSFTSNPLWKVVDGPFKLSAFSTGTGAYRLDPNPSYGLRPRPRVAAVAVRTYATPETMLEALRSGSLEIGSLEPTVQPGVIASLRRRGISVFGGPGWGWYGGVINFKDTTDDFDNVIAQPYMRGVLAELVDQAQMIRSVYHGWAVQAHGPVPVAPRSPYLTAAATRVPWPYDPARAVATLRAHGWRVRPGGRTTCRRTGVGDDECGAGIPAGTPISLVWANLPRSVSPVGVSESRILAGAAKRFAGIDISFVTAGFSVLTADYNDQGLVGAAARNSWAVNNFGGLLTDYYPTQAAMIGARGELNLGGYVSRRAQHLMAASLSSPGTRAVSAEISYLGRNPPVIYMPDPDWITAVSHRVGGPAQAFRAMDQQQYYFALIYAVGRR
ncbi:MAG: ABC transporter substrate-binding protein [Solirubrobacteraceae bacterium]